MLQAEQGISSAGRGGGLWPEQRLQSGVVQQLKGGGDQVACFGGAKGGLPDPLLEGFPDGAGEAEESGTIIGEEGGAEFEVIKGGNRQQFNVGTVD